jgi:hypothetical protein
MRLLRNLRPQRRPFHNSYQSEARRINQARAEQSESFGLPLIDLRGNVLAGPTPSDGDTVIIETRKPIHVAAVAAEIVAEIGGAA